MHDAARMRGFECPGDLQRQPPGFIRHQGAGERCPLDVLHHQVGGVSVVPSVVQGADVRVVERGDRLGFALEAIVRADP